MHTQNIQLWTHTHQFSGIDPGNERRTAVVVVLTACMMAAEIAAGFLYGSMALLADGWHMATHAAALGISVFAYRYARSHREDPRFTFGTGKVGILGGFTSAIALAIVALLMIGESFVRFFKESTIRFDEAILVAFIGLAVNIASALLLRKGGGHAHHAHSHAEHAQDHNLRAAYLHVVADAMTSILAIIALIAGKIWGQVWLDPMMGLIGGALIARWSYGLIRDTGRILLDAVADGHLLHSIRGIIESHGTDRVSDLHVWKVGSDTYAAVISIVTDHPQSVERYKEALSPVEGLSHVTIEVQRCNCTDPCT